MQGHCKLLERNPRTKACKDSAPKPDADAALPRLEQAHREEDILGPVARRTAQVRSLRPARPGVDYPTIRGRRARLMMGRILTGPLELAAPLWPAVSLSLSDAF